MSLFRRALVLLGIGKWRVAPRWRLQFEESPCGITLLRAVRVNGKG